MVHRDWQGTEAGRGASRTTGKEEPRERRGHGGAGSERRAGLSWRLQGWEGSKIGKILDSIMREDRGAGEVRRPLDRREMKETNVTSETSP